VDTDDVYIHTMEYCSAIKKNETMPFAASWMQPEMLHTDRSNQHPMEKGQGCPKQEVVGRHIAFHPMTAQYPCKPSFPHTSPFKNALAFGGCKTLGLYCTKCH